MAEAMKQAEAEKLAAEEDERLAEKLADEGEGRWGE